jgi:hypothetical protein
MAKAALLALTLLVAAPAYAAPPTSAPATISIQDQGSDELPPGAPTDDYGFVAWCYGALDESIGVYQTVLPDLRDIDAKFGSPVKEATPYAEDVSDEHKALKRFAAAMEAAERASPQPIAQHGVAAMNLGRSIWDPAKAQPRRQLAHAWLMWGLPNRCESTAKTLKVRATLLGQAMAIGAPKVDAPEHAAAPPESHPDTPPAPPPAATTTPDAPSIDTLLDSSTGASTTKAKGKGASAKPAQSDSTN